MLMVGDLIDLPTCQKELSVRLDSLKLRLCLVPVFLFFCFFFFSTGFGGMQLLFIKQ